jgi:predicted nucleic acid-binding protein
MMVLDTSGLLSAIDADQRQHTAAQQALEADPGPLFLSPFVLAELDFLLLSRVGVDAETSLLKEVATGAYRLERFDSQDVESAIEVIQKYEKLGIGLADASIVVLAARYRTTRILTLDDRHFRALRPLFGRAFKLLPADL